MFTVNHESFKIRDSLSPISVEHEPIRLQYPANIIYFCFDSNVVFCFSTSHTLL